ncbi:MAG TPA: hypothetical protein VIK97_00840 [Casimicrobiaceae bacterium]
MATIGKILIAGCAVSAALWITSVGATDAPGAMPGDDAMTCEAIGTELAPYAQQMMPNIQAMGNSQLQLYGQARQKYDERKLEHEAMAPLASAGALDPTGASKRAYAMAEMAQSAKERSEDKAFANSPLAQQNRGQSEQVAAQAQQMQSNARLQRLMQLAQQKHCDKKR